MAPLGHGSGLPPAYLSASDGFQKGSKSASPLTSGRPASTSSLPASTGSRKKQKSFELPRLSSFDAAAFETQLQKPSVTTRAVDKALALCLCEARSTVEQIARRHTSDGTRPGTGKEKAPTDGSPVDGVAILQDIGAQRIAQEMQLLRRELAEFERSTSAAVTQPLSGAVSNQWADLRRQRAKLETLVAQRNEIVASHDRSCESLLEQRAEFLRQIRFWKQKGEERATLGEQLAKEEAAAQADEQRALQNDFWKVMEKKELEVKALAKTVNHAEHSARELKIQLERMRSEKFQEARRQKLLNKEGAQQQYKACKKEAAALRATVAAKREARERHCMQAEDHRGRYFQIEEQSRESLRTSLARSGKIRELKQEKRELQDTLAARRTELAARSAEHAFAEWWGRQLQKELVEMDDRIAASHADFVVDKIQVVQQEILDFDTAVTEMAKHEQATLLHQEIYYKRRAALLDKLIASKRRQMFEADWVERQAVKREEDLEDSFTRADYAVRELQSTLDAVTEELARRLK